MIRSPTPNCPRLIRMPPPNRRSSKSPPNPMWPSRCRCPPTPRKPSHPHRAVSRKFLFLGLMLSAMACAKKEKSLEQLADEGDSVAQYEMGRQFYVGDHGRPRDLLMAYQWFVRAADAGHPKAQSNLGHLYAMGIGVEKNIVQAYQWFALAAA
ncbi:MAG TPA: hypothetical protein EYG19_06680, partial [Verrucomicrobia bacterium]|nr:hypothetical protein [Verrucomicrobiota bacterium]